MKNYRLSYDKCFIAMNSKGESLVIDGETIMDMSFLVEYRVYDRITGEEVFFTCPDTEEPREHNMNVYCRCAYDREKGFILTPTDACKNSKYRIEFIVDEESCTKGVESGTVLFGYPVSDSVFLSFEEFVGILKQYPDYFDTTTNQNAQSGAYAVTIVNQGEV